MAGLGKKPKSTDSKEDQNGRFSLSLPKMGTRLARAESQKRQRHVHPFFIPFHFNEQKRQTQVKKGVQKPPEAVAF